MRLTTKRQKILDTIKQHGDLCTAADIHQQMPEVDLATIYRNLEIFTQEKLIKKYHLQSSEAVYEYHHDNHHHAVCGACDKVLHIHAPDKKIIKLLDLEDFEVEELEIVVRGKCKK